MPITVQICSRKPFAGRLVRGGLICIVLACPGASGKAGADRFAKAVQKEIES